MRFFKDFIRNPQTEIALTFLTHIISGIDGVYSFTQIISGQKFQKAVVEKAIYILAENLISGLSFLILQM